MPCFCHYVPDAAHCDRIRAWTFAEEESFKVCCSVYLPSRDYFTGTHPNCLPNHSFDFLLLLL